MKLLRSIMSLIFIGLFIGSGILPSISGNKENISYLPDDELDQSNPGYVGWYAQLTGSNDRRAQQFTPSKDYLTRVFLYLHVHHVHSDPEELNESVVIHIREKLDGDNLATSVVHTKDFVKSHTPNQNYCVEFDFPDIYVTPNKPLFIVCSSNGDNELYLGWYIDMDGTYNAGSAWYFMFNSYWDEMEEADFCFDTYGRNNNPPNIPTVEYHKGNNELIISSIDSENHQVRFGISWTNDQTVDQWTDFVDSGTELRIECIGSQDTVGIIAEDEYGAQSDWVSVQSKHRSIVTSENTIIVDDEGDGDYTSIQDAIDNANSGDTIDVYSGIYHENIVIDKSLSLIGIDHELGKGSDSGKPINDRGTSTPNFGQIEIESEHVLIDGFIIKNSSKFGIHGSYSDGDITISNNIICNNDINGISFERPVYNKGSNIKIYNNIFYENGDDDSSSDAIFIVHFNNIEIKNNKLIGGGLFGGTQINLGLCSNVLIESNNISQTDVGIGIFMCFRKIIIKENNFFANNPAISGFFTLGTRFRNNYYDDWQGSGWYHLPMFHYDKNPAGEPYDI